MKTGNVITRALDWIASEVPDRLFGARITTDPADPEQTRIPMRTRTMAGVAVTPDLALRNATVWACHRYLSQTLGVLPMHVMLKEADGRKVAQPYHPVEYLLNTRASPEWSGMQMRETLTGWAVLWGNGYAEIERDMLGRAYAIHPIHPTRVTVERDAVNGDLIYRVDGEWGTGSGAYIVPAYDMLHLRGFGDGPVGLNVCQYAAESLGWARATEVFGSTFFGEGLNPSGFIETPEGLSEEAADELRQELNELHRGPARSHRIAIIDKGMKFNPWSTAPEDAQFIDTRHHQVDEVCRWFGVPPHKAQHLLRAHFTNIEHQGVEVVVDAVSPWAKRWELECDYKLFGYNRRGLYTKMNLNALMRGDAVSRANYYQTMIRNGIFSVNDVLDLEDMNRIGPEGDTHVMQAQMVSLESIANGTNKPALPPGGQRALPPGSGEDDHERDDGDEAGEEGEVMDVADQVLLARAQAFRVAA